MLECFSKISRMVCTNEGCHLFIGTKEHSRSLPIYNVLENSTMYKKSLQCTCSREFQVLNILQVSTTF